MRLVKPSHEILFISPRPLKAIKAQPDVCVVKEKRLKNPEYGITNWPGDETKENKNE